MDTLSRFTTLSVYLLVLLAVIWFTGAFAYIVWGIGAAILISKWLAKEPVIEPYVKRIKKICLKKH